MGVSHVVAASAVREAGGAGNNYRLFGEGDRGGRPGRVRGRADEPAPGAPDPGVQPGSHDVRARPGRLAGARPRRRRPGHRAARADRAHARAVGLGHDLGDRRGGRGRGGRGQLRPPGPRGGDARPLRGDRPRDAPQLLQRGREPDAVVHPALPLGPEQRAGHPPRGARRLGERLPGCQQPVRRRGQPGAGRGPEPGRHAPRLPPLHRPGGDPRRPPGRLPALLRPHPVEPAGLLADPAAPRPRGHPARAAGQRHRRLPHPQLRAQLPALLRGPARPARGLPAPPGALGGARRLGALLPDLGQRADVRGPRRARRRWPRRRARSCAAAAST